MTILNNTVIVRIDESNRTRLEIAARTKTQAQLHFKAADFQNPIRHAELPAVGDGFYEIQLSDAQLKRLNHALRVGSNDIV